LDLAKLKQEYEALKIQAKGMEKHIAIQEKIWNTTFKEHPVSFLYEKKGRKCLISNLVLGQGSSLETTFARMHKWED